MITYPVIFFGAGGPLFEDFEEYLEGDLPVYPQVWQYNYHQWLVPRNPTKYAGFTWKDYGVSGAFDFFESPRYHVGQIDTTILSNLKGSGNFEITPWTGLSAAFFRDKNGVFTSADQLRGYEYVNFDWGEGAPVSGYKTDDWCMRMIANVKIPTSGTYRMYVERDEGARIWVGRELGPSNLIFEKWGAPVVSGPEAATPFNFSAGIIDIRIDFYDQSGPAKLKLFWEGPDLPYRMMLPSDFGNSGYERFYLPFNAGFDQASGKLTFDGSYRFGYIYADPVHSDYGRNLLKTAGTYSPSVVKTDALREDFGRNELNFEGYHRYVYQPQKYSDHSRTNFKLDGFYTYTSTLADASDEAVNRIRFDGKYLEGRIYSYTQDLARNRLQMGGVFARGVINLDIAYTLGINEISPQGNYTRPQAPFLEVDPAFVEGKFDGNYYPIHIYATYEEQVQMGISPVGSYWTGYAISRGQDRGRIGVNHAGHAIYWQVSGDKKMDQGRTSLGFSYATYSFKDSSFASKEAITTEISQHGDYYPRYLSNPYADLINAEISPYGVYFSRFLDADYSDSAQGLIRPSGHYLYYSVPTFGNDFGKTEITTRGYHITKYVDFDRVKDFGGERINPQGNYFYAIDNYRYKDNAGSYLSYDGEYTPIYIYGLGDDYAFNQTNLEGLYYFNRAPVYFAENSQEFVDVQGFYINRFETSYSQDFGQVAVNTSGHYVTGKVEFDPKSSRGYGKVDPKGNYTYRSVDVHTTENVVDELGLEGLYFPRFVLTTPVDPAFSRYDLLGYHYSAYGGVKYQENAWARIAQHGVYFSKNANTYGIDFAKQNFTFSGDYFYGRVPVQIQEPAKNLLSFEQAFYSQAQLALQIIDLSSNTLLFDGEYIRDSWVTKDSTVLSLGFDSEYVDYEPEDKYATLFYWQLEDLTLRKQNATLSYFNLSNA